MIIFWAFSKMGACMPPAPTEFITTLPCTIFVHIYRFVLWGFVTTVVCEYVSKQFL